jgi:hypothetical protein
MSNRDRVWQSASLAAGVVAERLPEPTANHLDTIAAPGDQRMSTSSAWTGCLDSKIRAGDRPIALVLCQCWFEG